jgi:addiction module HigA family antidote
MAREYFVTREPRRPPTHPAALLREDVLPALDLSVTQVARDLGITRQTLHRLLAEKIGVSPEMAVRLGKFCGNGPDLWLRMQASHDLWHAERKMKGQISRIPTRRAATAAA